jgi:autotransporter-associated beta strand protein
MSLFLFGRARLCCVKSRGNLFAELYIVLAARVLAIAVAAVGLAETRFAFCQNVLEETTNWSGYSAAAPAGSAFTDVSSTWVIPSVKAQSSGTTYSSYWVGFDGVSDTTVEQCGVSADVSTNGSTTYNAWYEFAPAGEVVVPLTVHAGDTITAEVTYEGISSGRFNYQFDLRDQTTGASYDMIKSTSSNDARSSAEWIAEAPSLGSSVTTLANFGNVTFSNDLAALNGGSDVSLGALNLTENEMVQTNVVALPTSVNSTDSAFNVAYEPAALTWNNIGAYGPSDGVSWDFAGNNNWTTGSANAAYADGDPVTFNDNNNGHYAVTINSIFVHPASVTVNSSGNYTISGSGHIGGTGSLTKSGTGTLTLSTTNTYTGGTNVTGGWLIIEPTGSTSTALPEGPLSISGSGVLQLANNVTAGSQSANVPINAPNSNVVLTSLSIGGSGKLDITNNHIIIDYTGADPISSIAALIKSGYAAGTWTGTGITSTAAQSNSGSYGIGYADSADPGNPAGLASGQIEIMYTLLGDANLDGTVNGSDFAIVATDFNKAVNSWDQGDFNYDGSVNGADFALLAGNFNSGASQSAVSSADRTASDLFATANRLTADVPEPATAAIMLMAGTGILRRRRRSLT